MSRFFARIWYEEQTNLAARILLFPLWILSLIFALLVSWRRRYYAGSRRSKKVAARVISVGNIVAGGAGKTPVVIHLARKLHAAGKRPVILSRGYGRLNAGQSIMVSDGEHILQPVEMAGDEPTLIARACPGVPVLVGPDRVELANLAVTRFLSEVVVLDDGFQHLRLARDLDVVVVDAASPFGNGHLMPAGPLREPVSALKRAQLIWLSKVDQADPMQVSALERRIHALTGREVIKSSYRVSQVMDVQGRPKGMDALHGRRVLMMAGVGRPDSFRKTLQAMGAQTEAEYIFPDHGWFSSQQIESMLVQARRQNIDAIVLTEKDMVRMPLGMEGPFVVVRVEVNIEEGEGLINAVL